MLNVVNNWWARASFSTKEKITGFRRIDFTPDDGYQEFLDACDKWWDWMTLENKVFYYQMYN